MSSFVSTMDAPIRSRLYYARELIKLLYPRSTPDRKLSDQAALAAVSQACDEIRKLEYIRTMADSTIVPSQWITPYWAENAVVVQQDSHKNLYCQLPAKPIEIIQAKSDIGVQRVWPHNCYEQLIMPLPMGYAMFQSSPIKNIGGRMGYMLVGDSLIFRLPGNLKEGDKIEMDLFASANSLGVYERMPMSDAMANDVLLRAREIWTSQKQIPEDIQTDAVSE